MKTFLDDDFLLESQAAILLYHEYAENLPIIDYHNHLPPDEIAVNKRFVNITEAWLKGDHYKWRVMRAHGVVENEITGTASDEVKFMKWAETVPYTMGNPLYHWTHLELKRIFGIDELLSPSSAPSIFERTSGMLRNTLSVHDLLRQFKVKVLCTTDDPVDSLEFHRQIRDSSFSVNVLPAFRADKAMAVEVPEKFNQYIRRLEVASEMDIHLWHHFLDALRDRHDFFHAMGCRLSDHGLETFYANDYKESEIAQSFIKIRHGQHLSAPEIEDFKSACLYELARMDAARGWTQQFHIGALRNNNSRLFKLLGADSGTDSIGDFRIAEPMSRFFDRLDRENSLARTIIYNLNPSWNEVFATMAGNFNDGSVTGKMQYGAAWWFLDQKDGIESQLRTLANMGMLSHSVGMLTDSRSFLSFTRHEYFRRILCQFIGRQVDTGELPHDLPWLGKLVKGICFDNAEKYFHFGV